MKWKLLFLIVCTVLSRGLLLAQTTAPPTNSRKGCVELTATVSSSPASITLNWVKDDRAQYYAVTRKSPNSLTWDTLQKFSENAGQVISYKDVNVVPNVLYEYQVYKHFKALNGAMQLVPSNTFGYILSGINVDNLQAYKGRVIVVVDETFKTTLAQEINTYLVDLFAEGYLIDLIYVSRVATVKSVKQQILTLYQRNPTEMRGVMLIGHVPVPYSGDTQAPDGHKTNHAGAHPADLYYGDINENEWTDFLTVPDNTTFDPRNKNIPGDGKYDQYRLNWSNSIEMWVGRVDLSGLTFYTSKTELQMMKDYFARNHSYRTKGTVYEKKALITDGWVKASSYTQGGIATIAYRSFAPLVGSNNLVVQTPPEATPLQRDPNHISMLQRGNYQFSYAAASGWDWWSRSNGDSMETIFTTRMWSEAYNVKTVFSGIMASYMSDWDHDNSALKCILASGALTSMWVTNIGNSPFAFHHMGMGFNLGEQYLLFHNRSLNLYTGISGLYDVREPGTGIFTLYKPVFQSILGDPTLRADIIARPPSVNYTYNTNGYSISWTPSPEPGILGYNIYSLSHGAPAGKWVKLNSAIVTGTSYNNICSQFNNVDRIVVKAVKLITTPSGSYYVESAGTTNWIKNDLLPSFTVTVTGLTASFNNTTVSDNPTVSYKWEFSDGTVYLGKTPPAKTFTTTGAKTAKLTVYNSCRTVTAIKQFTIGVNAQFSRNPALSSGKEEDGTADNLNIYPNPSTTGLFTIEVGNADQGGTVFVYDAAGKQVASYKNVSNKLALDLSSKAKGVYLVQYVSSDGARFKKTIVYR